MKKTEKIYMVGQLIDFDLPLLKESVLDWISFIRILTTPITMQFNMEQPENFDLFHLKERVEALTNQNNDQWFKIISDHGEFHVHVFGKTIFERNILDKEIYVNAKLIFDDYCDKRMIRHGLYGYVRSYDEYLENNVAVIEERTFNTPEELKHLPKMYDKEKQVIVDCNQLAGYDVFYKGLCMTSCWKMYYSNVYFQLIPRQVFMEIQQVQSIVELSEQMIRIELYTDPFNWDHEVNLKYQRLFRDQIGFDQLAWNNGIGVLREPYIEFAYGDDTVQTVQYQNDLLQPIEKKKATYFVTRTYDFIQNRYLEKRTRGALNAQAFFPWVDEGSMKMMNYRVLNPEFAIDNGLDAYEFYIRQFLEIEIQDERYQDFTSVLRFYLPKETIETIPLDDLQDRLQDVNISNLKQKKLTTRFDLKKEQNHLRVVFLDYSYLDSISNTIETRKAE